MSNSKKNFTVYDRVQLTGAGTMTGECGTILGRSHVNVTDIYIVLLDINRTITHHFPETITFDEAAICISENCLELINDMFVNGIEIT